MGITWGIWATHGTPIDIPKATAAVVDTAAPVSLPLLSCMKYRRKCGCCCVAAVAATSVFVYSSRGSDKKILLLLLYEYHFLRTLLSVLSGFQGRIDTPRKPLEA